MTDDGIVTSAKLESYLKLALIVVTVDGITTFLRLSITLKAPDISVTVKPSILLGILTVLSLPVYFLIAILSALTKV